MDSDDVYVRLIREIEIEKGKLLAHEGICGERYSNITAALESLGSKLDSVVTSSARSAGSTNKRLIGFMVAVISILFSAVAWEAGQLYSMEPLRVASITKTVVSQTP